MKAGQKEFDFLADVRPEEESGVRLQREGRRKKKKRSGRAASARGSGKEAPSDSACGERKEKKKKETGTYSKKEEGSRPFTIHHKRERRRTHYSHAVGKNENEGNELCDVRTGGERGERSRGRKKRNSSAGGEGAVR